jgi:acyl-CoA hydrolase
MTELVLPGDTNPLGNIFGGRVMAWIDIAASVAAIRHCHGPVVTASIDDLHFLAPVKLAHIVTLLASVNFVHRTSMEVGVRVEGEDPKTGERRHTASAYVTVVALDDYGRPREVPGLVCETAEEKERFGEAQARRTLRLKLREAKRAAEER